METRKLGAGGPEVSAIGLGTMSFGGAYGPAEESDVVDALDAALDAGITLVDTANAYGGGRVEELVGRVLGPRRERIVLATKVGLVFPDGKMAVDGSRENVRAALEASLRRLQTEYVDLLYLHRVDPDTPIEETVGAMGELIAEGKLRHAGLCETNAETLRRAHAAYPLAALQSEYSLWTRDVEDAVLPTAQELGIALVAYSPLGRGWLTGRLRTPADIGDHDFRRFSPQFQPGNFERNLELADEVRAIAEAKRVTPPQLALAWLLSRGPMVVPIFGTRRRASVEENAAAVDVALSPGELERLDELLPAGAAAGDRWPAEFMAQLNR